MSRAALMASTSTIVALASCSAYGQGPYCPRSVTLSSLCGFEVVQQDCAGATTKCNEPLGPAAAATSCTISQVTTSCTISVVLGDGTSHVVPVTAGKSPYSSCGDMNVVLSPTYGQSFGSSTCHVRTPEAGADAPDDAADEG